MSNRILSDQPTTDDVFGYQKAATTLADIIVSDKTETPFTIGIFGEWGTGKTSLLKMIEAKVQQFENLYTIWFDPWRYDEKHIIQTALIQTILAKLDMDPEKSESFKQEVVELTKRFLTFIAAKTVEIGTSGLVKPFEIAQQASEIIIKDKFKQIRDWNELEQAFAKVVKAYVGQNGRLIIFIDDLDRCLPENAIQVLEAIKLFLAQKNCIFVLSVEKKGIEEAISLRYKDNPQMSGVKYLEKIIQLPFFLPQPEPVSIETYVHKLSGEIHFLYETQNIIKAGTDNNPRRIKRFINTFTLLHSIASHTDLEEPVLAKIIMLQLQFPKTYRFLCNDPAVIDRLTDISVTDKPVDNPKYLVYKDYLEEPHLIPFLSKTRYIYPKDHLWDPYFYFIAMINV